MNGRPDVEYHVWHTPDGEIRAVGRVAPGAPSNLGAVPLAPKHPGLQVTTVVLPEVQEPAYFERVLLRQGRFVDWEGRAAGS